MKKVMGIYKMNHFCTELCLLLSLYSLRRFIKKDEKRETINKNSKSRKVEKSEEQ